MYGPHETGADFDKWEVTLLENFAKRVAVGYETLTKARCSKPKLRACARNSAPKPASAST